MMVVKRKARWVATHPTLVVCLACVPVWSQMMEPGGGVPTSSKPASAVAGYVGSESCVGCHAEIARSYAEVGMARAFFPPTADNIIEDYQSGRFYHAASDRYYEMTHRPDGFFVRRFQQDVAGREINAFEQRITHVIGSGNHSRGYVYRTESGEMFQMPVAWYTQGKKWGMAPGYDHARHDGFTRPITRECMFCHNDYPDAISGSDRFGEPSLFPEHLPHGIGCERCHGPGADHVRIAADETAPIKAIRASIVNPARLEPALRHDVCLQCHLQPSSRLTSFIRRFGRADYSYRPGTPLGDYLVHIEYVGRVESAVPFEIDSAAYRLRQSTCFVSSGGALMCTTCHNPHRKVPPGDTMAHYRERCFRCHKVDACGADAMHATDAKIAPDDCVTCHMPKRRTQDVIHVAMTDHKIQRHRPTGDLLAPLAERPLRPEGGPTLYPITDKEPAALDEVYLAVAAAKDAAPGALQRLGKALHEANPQSVEPYVSLGIALLANGRYDEAIRPFSQVVARDMSFAPGWSNLGVALAGVGRLDVAVEHFRAALELSGYAPDTHFNLAVCLARGGRNEEAIEQYLEALRVRPYYAKCRFNLGNVYARVGRFAEAIKEYRRALIIDPNLFDAYKNLGSALVQTQNWAEAIRIWRHGVGQSGDRGELSGKLALALLTAPDESLRDHAEALRLAIAAARVDQRDGERAETVAFALLLNDRFAEASAAAMQAERLGGDAINSWLIKAVAGVRLEHPEAVASCRKAIAAASADPMETPVRWALSRLVRKLLEGAGALDP